MSFYNIPFRLAQLQQQLEVDSVTEDKLSIKQTVEADFDNRVPSITQLHQEIQTRLLDYRACNFEDIFEMSHDELGYAYGVGEYYESVIVGYLADHLYGELYNVLGNYTPAIDKCVLIQSTITPFGGIVTIENREGLVC